MLTLPTTYTMCDHASITKYNIFFSCECDTFGLYSHSGRVWAHDLSWQIRVIVTVWQTLYRNIISLFLYLHLWWFVLSIARAITPFLQFFKESMSLRWWWQHKKMHLSLSMTRRPFLNFALCFFLSSQTSQYFSFCLSGAGILSFNLLEKKNLWDIHLRIFYFLCLVSLPVFP